ncbi:chromate transporter [Paenibacillus sp. MBLB4367]|uniref:chromate transporter n=1 Tax=Paenibacillus sp. MBLB4367 TaxID=3384767 RepID=UPI003908309F
MGKHSGTTDWRLLADIFWSFFKIAPVTFGGGYAMIPVIEREVVEKRRWISEEEMVDALSIAGSAPGGVGVNAATFIGFRTAGVKGAIAAVIGITLPTFLIVLGLSLVFIWLEGNEKMTAAFEGIKSAVVAMIVYAAYRIGRSAVFDKATLATVIGAVVILLFAKLNPVIVMALGALLGIGLIKLKEKLGMAVRLEKHEKQAGGGQTETAKPFYRYDDYYIGEGI